MPTCPARFVRFAIGASLMALACTTSDAPADTAASTPSATSVSSPADDYLAALRSHCDKAYEGRLIDPQPADSAMRGQRLVMHVRGCGDTVRIPFHVGEDRSRTWVLTRTAEGVRLKHDHRHADGTPDAVTMYGGDSRVPGTAVRQEFPVDAGSVAMFEREGLKASVANTWAMEIEPGTRLRYELARPDGGLFQVEFDLSAPVEPPPAPWGDEAG